MKEIKLLLLHRSEVVFTLNFCFVSADKNNPIVARGKQSQHIHIKILQIAATRRFTTVHLSLFSLSNVKCLFLCCLHILCV